MSAYSTKDYEFSFAERTLRNLELIEKRVNEEKSAGKKDDDITDAFEVTQLLNSFVGFLVIPRQKCFKFLPDDKQFPKGSKANQVFTSIVNNPEKIVDTYHEKVFDMNINKWVSTTNYEKVTPKTIVLHLRNAIAHDRLRIIPISPGKNGVITGIEFSDHSKNKNGIEETFKLSLSVEETRILVKGLCSLLISCYPGYENFKIE